MDDRQNILVVEVEPLLFDRIAPILMRRNFEVDRFPDAAGALELVGAVPFSAIIIGFPMRAVGLEDFLTRVATGESAVASIAVLAARRDHPKVEPFLNQGIDLVLSLEEAASEMQRLLCALLGISPRANLRVMVKLEVAITDTTNERFAAQTEDISTSGMLIATSRLHPIGSRARFSVSPPGEPLPIEGLAEVTRHAQPGIDRIRGMGFRFLSFRGDGKTRMERSLKRLLGSRS